MAVQQALFNPFPGLRPFEAEEDYLFFGREGQVDELLRRIKRQRFLAVVGTSGSGKSSLVRAGLLPALYSGFMTSAGTGWRVAVLRPGNEPISNLARALNEPDVLGTEGEEAPFQVMLMEAVLRRGSLGLVEVMQQARLPHDENLLIVVDQFEELFRFTENVSTEAVKDEAAAFVKLLLAAKQAPDLPIFVILTMRSDYLGDCAQFRDLPEALNDNQYLIPRMTRDQLRLAIEGPVKVGRGEITPRLVNQLLNDVGDNPEQLPVLQHALMRTWDYWEEHHQSGEMMDLSHYEAVGGLNKALSNHADEILSQLPSDNERRLAEKLFKCLTLRSSDGRGIRRPTSMKELCEITAASFDELTTVAEQFRGPGRSFIMPPYEFTLTEDSVLDISHESLMRIWDKLRSWMDEEADSARIYLRLSETAELYNKDNASLLIDPELALALSWHEAAHVNPTWARQYGSNSEQFSQAISFLEQSREDKIYKEWVRAQQELDQKLISNAQEVEPVDVYISYSRLDKEVAINLNQALLSSNIKTWIDLQDLIPAQNWLKQIEDVLDRTLNFLFLMSKSSLNSEFCMKELEAAAKRGLRIIPVVIDKFDIDNFHLPPFLAALQWRFLEADFQSSASELVSWISLDLDLIRTGARLQVRAQEWEMKGRNESYLIRGVELQQAESWVASSLSKGHKLTKLQESYVEKSRLMEDFLLRTRNRLLGLVLASFSLGLIFFAIAYLEASKAREAEHAAERAMANEREAKLAEERARTNQLEALKRINKLQSEKLICRKMLQQLKGE